uniref:Uncharacterized protein n=1 Tax=Heterorhabditis bacteriophora TaxID=37862 RepID=A0A1I7XR01_HETBA
MHPTQDYNKLNFLSSSHKALSRHTGRGSVASSPVTSSSEGYTAEMWRDSLPRHQINGSRTGESVLPLGNSTCLSSTPQFLARRSPALIPYSITPSQRRVAPIQEEVAKTVEVKVQRSERTERTEKMENKEWTNKNATYAEPIVRSSIAF